MTTLEQGIPRHAHKRGTYSGSSYKGNVEGSNSDYSFHYIGTGNKLYVFEAPIDLLSYLSIHKENWRENSYVALCSVAVQAVVYLLKYNPQLHTIVSCLEHDKAGHGIPPIPAAEHPGQAQMKEKCLALAGGYAGKRCPKEPLEELQQHFNRLKRQAAYKIIDTKQSYEMAGIAFLFATKQLAAMEKQVSADEMASRLFALYQPHHDNIGKPSRMAQIGETLQELKQAVDNNEILPESGQEKIVRKTMSLAVDCLRLSFVYANLSQCPPGQSQNSERRENPCPVLQQS